LIKLKVKTPHPAQVQQFLTELGAGRMDGYTECFFTYPDANGRDQWVETVCDRQVLEEYDPEAITNGQFQIEGLHIMVSPFLDNPIAHSQQ